MPRTTQTIYRLDPDLDPLVAAALLRSAGKALTKIVRKGAKPIGSAVKRVVKKLPKIVRNVSGKIKSTAKRVVRKLPNVVRKIGGKVKETAKRVVNKLPRVVRKVGTKVKDTVKRVVNKLPRITRSRGGSGAASFQRTSGAGGGTLSTSAGVSGGKSIFRTALGMATLPVAGIAGLLGPVAGDIAAPFVSENDKDPFQVKDAVRNADNIWEVYKIVQARDELRERGITSEFTGGHKATLDVNTIPRFRSDFTAMHTNKEGNPAGHITLSPNNVWNPSRRRAAKEAAGDDWQIDAVVHELAHARDDVGVGSRDKPGNRVDYTNPAQANDPRLRGSSEGYARGWEYLLPGQQGTANQAPGRYGGKVPALPQPTSYDYTAYGFTDEDYPAWEQGWNQSVRDASAEYSQERANFEQEAANAPKRDWWNPFD